SVLHLHPGNADSFQSVGCVPKKPRRGPSRGAVDAVGPRKSVATGGLGPRPRRELGGIVTKCFGAYGRVRRDRRAGVRAFDGAGGTGGVGRRVPARATRRVARDGT